MKLPRAKFFIDAFGRKGARIFSEYSDAHSC